MEERHKKPLMRDRMILVILLNDDKRERLKVT